MGLKPSLNPTSTGTQTTDSKIGEAYHIVKAVEEKLVDIATVAQNVETMTFIVDNIDAIVNAGANIATIEALVALAENKASQAETAATAAVNAKVASEVAETNAEAARDTAIAKAGEAETARAAAETAQAGSETARDKAGAWANSNENVVVETGSYSAKHHAIKAAASETAAAGSATNASTARTGAEAARDGAISAKNAAETAETNAETAETNAAASADIATTKAGEAATSATTASTKASEAAASAATAQAAANVAGGFRYLWSTDTAASDPGAGKLKLNAGNTTLYISETDQNGAALAAVIATWDDSTNTALRATIKITKVGAPEVFRVLSVTGAITDSGAYDSMTVALVVSNGVLANNDPVVIEVSRTGNLGGTGAAGSTVGVSLIYSNTTTDGDPGNGIFRFNHATIASATQLYVDNLEVGGASLTAWLDALDDSTSAVKGMLYFKGVTTPAAFAVFRVTGVVVDGTGYRKVNLVWVASGGAWTTGNNFAVVFAPSGDAGDGSVLSVNTKTGAVTLTTDDISDAGQTNKWATATEKTKLGHITVTQAVDLDAIETQAAAGAAAKVKTDWITITQAVDLDAVEVQAASGAAAKTKTDLITVTAATNLDTIRTTVAGLGTASTRNTGTASGNVPLLDGSGKLDSSVIPSVALVDVFTVASQAAMLALSSAAKGDVAIRTDLNKSFVLSTNNYATLTDWKELLTPTDAVLSVAGLTGAISSTSLKTALNLTKADVGLSNADNTSDANKPVSTAQAAAIGLKLDKVASRASLKAVNTAAVTAVILTEAGREGLFVWKSGNYATLVTADALEGIYIKADAIAASAGAWVRQFVGPVDVRWFGATNDNSGNAAAGIQAAIDLVEVIGAATTEGPVGSVWGPPGTYRCTSSIAFTRSIVFRLEGQIYYTPTTGSAVIVGDALNDQHTFYDISGEGIRAVNGNGSVPISINGSGCIGLEIRRLQFSHVHFGQIIGFTKHGVHLNSANDQFTGQQIQDNDLSFDQLAYNGAGLLAESVSAENGACQVNRINIQNSFANFRNVELGKNGDNNTNHNVLNIAAIDFPGAGGSELRVFGWYNIITLGFVDTNGIVSFETGSASNFIHIGRNAENVTYSDAGTGNTAIFSDGVRRGLERFKTASDSAAPLAIESTEAGASYAQLLELYRNSASPADNDGGVGILGYFNDGAGNKTLGLRIRTDMPTVADGNENQRLLIDTIVGGTLANRMSVWQGVAVGNVADQGGGTINALTAYYLNSTKVVGARRTGWGAPTGTATRTTFATGSVTLPQLAERVKALIDDQIAHGLIGA